jgi:DNA-3-methyladenine glycosylase II
MLGAGFTHSPLPYAHGGEAWRGRIGTLIKRRGCSSVYVMILVHPSGPYDLRLSLEAASAFSPELPDNDGVLRTGVVVGGLPAIMEISQVQAHPPVLQVSSPEGVDERGLREIAEWTVLADLDLTPFYAFCAGHPVLGPITGRLHGLKHLRPATVFEMAVIAVTEQQISLAAAYRIRGRIVERFGRQMGALRIFPAPRDVAAASIEGLASCGLSRRKAEYIRGFAIAVKEGDLDIESIRYLSDDDARAVIAGQRGFGRWSAEYILIRGLGRADCVPSDDLGIRSILGRYLGDGSRMTAANVEDVLRPFRPYRGLAVFYLLANSRLLERETSVGARK